MFEPLVEQVVFSCCLAVCSKKKGLINHERVLTSMARWRGEMRVLVLGGTGAIGKPLVQLLAENGIDTFVTTRQRDRDLSLVNYINGNAREHGLLKSVLSEKWDAVIDFMAYSTAEFKARVDLLLASTPQYVYLSSARVYADTDQLITEDSARLLDVCTDDEYLSSDEYALAKARQEDMLRDSGCRNWTIIRPYITYGDNRLQLGVLEKEEWLHRALQNRTIVFCSDLVSKRTTLTSGIDVAKGISSVLGVSEAMGHCFNVTGSDTKTWGQVLAVYTDLLKKFHCRSPNVLLLDMREFQKCTPARYQIEYDRLFHRRFDNTRIARFVDTSQFLPIDQGLEASMLAYIKSPNLHVVNGSYEAAKDKATGEFTPISQIKGMKQKVRYMAYRYLAYQLR